MNANTVFFDMTGKQIDEHATGVLVGIECFAVEMFSSGKAVKVEGPFSFRDAVLTASSMAGIYGATYRGLLQY